jgi:pimeloyl-ACP methyl ester carboxylesterase
LATHRLQGYLGVFSDLNYRGDWRDLLRTCPVKVRMVAGAHDRCFQWAEAESWAAKLPHAQLERLPDSGYMVHHQHSNRIMDWLKDDLSAAPC